MRYEAPETVDQAVALLAAGERARVLAGGTDLLVQLRSDRIDPDVVIDIKRIDGMRAIAESENGFRIGAAVSAAELHEHAGVKAAWPGVADAAYLIGSTQIQGRATLVGNLCNASPAADTVPALIAADATLSVAGPAGRRSIAAADLATAPGRTSLAPGELIEAVLLPARTARSADAYLRFTPRTEMDIAVVGAAVNLSLGEDDRILSARVALGAVAPTAVLVPEAAKALIGTAVDTAALDALADACSTACAPIDDKRGTVAFRTEVAQVLAKRATRLAFDRALEGGRA
ncbi:MAG: xanthine dehydrogenase family protein subunit M [Pseudomonadota bacterium]